MKIIRLNAKTLKRQQKREENAILYKILQQHLF